MLGCRIAHAPMKVNVKLLLDRGRSYGRYHKFADKLIYLTVTRPDIAFVVSVASQFSLSTEDHSLGCSSINS